MFGTGDFVAGALCLDFVNTVGGDRAGEHSEKLKAYPDFLDWAETGEVLPQSRAPRLRRLAQEQPGAAERTLRRVRQFREALHAVFQASMHGHPAPGEALESVNGEIARAMAHTRLAPSGWHYTLEFAHEDVLEAPLWPVAHDAAQLLTSGKLARLTECGGDICSWLFLDLTKNRSRRWCDMTACGNRAKVRRYRERSANRP
jgi:predicted RNA-binding Zn ribbon-like protein